MEVLYKVLEDFIGTSAEYSIRPFGSGLIHKTFIVEKNGVKTFVLQQVNVNVFKWPSYIAENIEALSSHLNTVSSLTKLPTPLQTLRGDYFTIVNENYFRLLPFVSGSHSIDACTIADQAYEAAKQFANFTASFNTFDVTRLKQTIPNFHNLSFRWNQFRDALKNGNAERIKYSSKEINALENDYSLVTFYEKVVASNAFRLRVTHHDTKISNVLFNDAEKGICVIDLDTVMPGYFISDLGDMFRTYLSSANEEEKDLQRIEVRRDFYKAIVEGYKDKMADQMTDEELLQLNYAGEFMIYMQALRFLTDYINDDVYYAVSYENNNYLRALNQLTLLRNFRAING